MKPRTLGWIDKRMARLSGWKSPVSDYPKTKLGVAAISKRRVDKDSTFFAEGVRGFLFYEFTQPAQLTELRIRGKTWMTDSPEYVWSLESFAKRSRGNVLVAGLGLGIVVHQLANNPAVKRITVIECEADVICMVRPLLPEDKRIHIIHDRFARYVETTTEKYDTVIWDLAVRSGNTQINVGDLLVAEILCHIHLGDVQVFRHGLDRDPKGERFAKTQEFRRVKESFKQDRRTQ